MKEYGIAEVKFHAFSRMLLGGGEQTVSCSVQFFAGKFLLVSI
jgi:hypothetical protein